MKKTAWIPLSILLGFCYVIAHHMFQTGYLNLYMFGILLLLYFFWVLVAGFPTLTAFAFQCFACNTTTNLILRLIPTIIVVALLVLECLIPLYGLLNIFLSGILGISRWIIVPLVLAGLAAGWVVKAQGGDEQ